MHFKLPSSNWLMTEFYPLEVWLGIPSLIYQILLGTSIGNSTQWNIQAHSTGPWLWPHLHISNISIARTLRPVNACPDWKLPTVPKIEPLQGEGNIFYVCLWSKKEKCPTQCQILAFLRSATTFAMCCHPDGDTHPPSPIPLSLYSKEPISKWIASTDNMLQNQMMEFQVNYH